MRYIKTRTEILENKYKIDTEQNGRDIQLPCIVYMFNRNPSYIEHNTNRENLCSNDKIKLVHLLNDLG